jgi:hypothetical protein
MAGTLLAVLLALTPALAGNTQGANEAPREGRCSRCGRLAVLAAAIALLGHQIGTLHELPDGAQAPAPAPPEPGDGLAAGEPAPAPVPGKPAEVPPELPAARTFRFLQGQEAFTHAGLGGFAGAAYQQALALHEPYQDAERARSAWTSILAGDPANREEVEDSLAVAALISGMYQSAIRELDQDLVITRGNPELAGTLEIDQGASRSRIARLERRMNAIYASFQDQAVRTVERGRGGGGDLARDREASLRQALQTLHRTLAQLEGAGLRLPLPSSSLTQRFPDQERRDR